MRAKSGQATQEEAAYAHLEWPYDGQTDQDGVQPPPAFERLVRKLVRGRHFYVAIYCTLGDSGLFVARDGETFADQLRDATAIQLADSLLHRRNLPSDPTEDEEDRNPFSMAVFDPYASFSERVRHMLDDTMVILDVPGFVFEGIARARSAGDAASIKAALARIADPRHCVMTLHFPIRKAAARIDAALQTHDFGDLRRTFDFSDIMGYSLRRELREAEQEVAKIRWASTEDEEEERQVQAGDGGHGHENTCGDDSYEDGHDDDDDAEHAPDFVDEDEDDGTGTDAERAAHARMLAELDQAKAKRERLEEERRRERRARESEREAERERNRERARAEQRARIEESEARSRARDLERRERDCRRDEARRREEDARRSRKPRHYRVEVLSSGCFSARGGSNMEGNAIREAVNLSKKTVQGKRMYPAVRVVDQDGHVVFSC